MTEHKYSSPETNVVGSGDRIADAIEACDWSGSPIGNKEILKAAARELRSLQAWQRGALSCREAEQSRVDEYKRELEEALCAHDLATRAQTAAFAEMHERAEKAEKSLESILAPSTSPEPNLRGGSFIESLSPEQLRIHEALCDSQYIAGAKAGWNAGCITDPTAAQAQFTALIESRERHLEGYADARSALYTTPRAPNEGVG